MTNLTPSRAFGIAAFRVVVGLVFIYAGLEKLLGAEPFTAFGFLSFGTAGTAAGAAEGAIVNPTHQFWLALSTNGGLLGVVNWLVPLGQVAIGAALILGLATRFAALMGVLMMVLFSIAAWDFVHGPFNQTVLIAIATLFLAVVRAGEVYGVDAIVDKSRIVNRTPLRRYVFG